MKGYSSSTFSRTEGTYVVRFLWAASIAALPERAVAPELDLEAARGLVVETSMMAVCFFLPKSLTPMSPLRSGSLHLQ
jgi:hypothetical protein